MKKLFYWLTSIVCIVALICIAPTTYADTYRVNNEGLISMSIRFDHYETYDDVSNRNITFSLYQDDKHLGSTKVNTLNTTIGQYDLLIEENTSITDGVTLLDSYYVSIDGLAYGNYSLVVTGDKHKTYRSDVISVNDFNKHISLGSGDSSFTYGDVNQDGKVDQLDVQAIMNAIDTTQSQYDLTNDGIVDLFDLVFFEKNHHVVGGGEVIDTGVLNTNNLLDEVVLEEHVQVDHPDGANALFYNNALPIVVVQEEKVSEQPIIIPVPLIEPMELEVLSIDSIESTGGITSATFIVTYYDSFLKLDTTKEFLVDVRDLEDTTNKIEYVLPEKLLVSNLSLRIESVQDDVEFAAVRKVSFAKEYVKSNPISISTSVSDLEIIPDNGSLEVSFSPLANVDGYEVLVGTESGVYTNSYYVEEPYVLIEGLENFVYHYVTVQAKYLDWVGPQTDEIQIVPSPEDRFGVVDEIKTTHGDRSVLIEWEDLELADYYRVLAKRSSQGDDEYQEVAYHIEGNSVAIDGLWNDVPYTFAVQGCNDILDSIVSLSVEGTPISAGYEIPTLPSLDRIDNKTVERVSFIGDRNVFEPYDDLFDIEYVLDEKHSSYWTASPYYDVEPGLRFDFNEAVTMDYIMWTPRLDGDWISYLSDCFVRVQTENSDRYMNVSNSFIEILYDEQGEPYVLIAFDKVKGITSIEVGLYPEDQTDEMQMVSLSEISFYESNTFDEEIGALFSDSSRIALHSSLDMNGVEALKQRILDEDRYVTKRDALVQELELALRYEQGLDSTGIIIPNLQVVDTSNDVIALNNLSPLGVLGRDNRELVVYAHVPKGANVSLVTTNTGTVSGEYITATYPLVDGKNTIRISDQGSGGSIYYTYTGTSGVNVHVYQQSNPLYTSKVESTPVLNLSNYNQMSESQVRESVTSYLTYLSTFTKTFSGDYHPGDTTDVVLPNSMITMNATDLYNACSSVDKMVSSIGYLNDLVVLLNKTGGVDQQTGRYYIRYIDNQYGYYQYGNTIGTTVTELNKLFSGSYSTIYNNTNFIDLLSIQLDEIGYIGVSNKMFGYIAKSYDGANNTALNDPFNYEDVYNYLYKDDNLTTSIQQAMYWQLQTAYASQDNAAFFGSVNKILRSNEYSHLNSNDRLIIAFSRVANVDLRNYFSLWNIHLSSNGIASLNSLNLTIEQRPIQFLTGLERTYRLQGGQGVQGNFGLQHVVDVSNYQGRVWIWADHQYNQDDVLGIEIYRNGELIDFIYDISYTDVIDKALFGDYRYDIYVIDRLGNRIKTDQYIQVSLDDFVRSIEEE